MGRRAGLVLGLVVVVLAACSGAPATTGAAPPSGAASAEPTASGHALDAARAAQLVLGSEPRFRGIQPADPALVGQASWYRVAAAGDGFDLTVRIGWGDCPSGCLAEHSWRFHVTRGGLLQLLGESGPSVPPDAVAGPGVPTVSGLVTAGPTCAVVSTTSPDPACRERPVAGATLVVQDAAGQELDRVQSGADGAFQLTLPAGSYRLVPQPVAGLLGTAPPVAFAVPPNGPPITLAVRYDTGIR